MAKQVTLPYHQTTDLTEAAALVSLGCKVHEAVWADEEQGVVAWIITIKRRQEKAVKAFLEELRNGEALVEPRRFMHALREVKEEMYQLKDSKKETEVGVTQ